MSLNLIDYTGQDFSSHFFLLSAMWPLFIRRTTSHFLNSHFSLSLSRVDSKTYKVIWTQDPDPGLDLNLNHFVAVEYLSPTNFLESNIYSLYIC